MEFVNEYEERKEAVDKALVNYHEGNEQLPEYLSAVTQVNIAWALLDIAESLDNIRQNGVQVETFTSAHQPFS